jgi:hypothetical protein
VKFLLAGIGGTLRPLLPLTAYGKLQHAHHVFKAVNMSFSGILQMALEEIRDGDASY